MRFVLFKEQEHRKKSRNARGYFIADASLAFQAGWSGRMYFFFFYSFQILN
jgi:hypothetical protein